MQLENHAVSKRPIRPPTVAVMRNGTPLDAFPRSPPFWREVLLAILDQHNWAHAKLAKNVSNKTMAERRHFLFSFFRELRQHGYWIDPRSLKPKHLQVMVQAWTARGLRGGTMQSYLSQVRVFCTWIGKPGMVPDLERLTPTPEVFDRTYVATESKAWPAKEVVPDDVIGKADAADCFVGAQLRMQSAFGLRVKEALLIQPHISVTYVEGQGAVLMVRRGTKGGRERFVPIDSDAKRLALEHARQVAPGREQSLAHPGLSLVRAYRRFYYVMSKIGVTRAELGVTAHGLRHGYAANEYEKLAGAPPPVAKVDGSSVVPRDVDHSARLRVAEHLGHSRKQITGAYLGGVIRSLRKGTST